MSQQRFYSGEKIGEIRLTKPLVEYCNEELFAGDNPFCGDSWLRKFTRHETSRFLNVIEKLLGVQLFVENKHNELAMFSPVLRKFLAKLVTEGVFGGWEFGSASVDRPWLKLCSVYIKPFEVEDGSIINKNYRSITGYGYGEDADTALFLAIAEALERLSASDWSDQKVTIKSINELKEEKISFFAKYFHGNKELDENNKMGWVSSVDVVNNKKVLVPASMSYLFYSIVHKNEPDLWHTSTNGVALHSDKDKSFIAATYEAFERDGLLMYWLNKVSPQRIAVESIEDKYFQDRLKMINDSGVDVYLLDCHTELMVPVVVAFAHNKKVGTIHLSADAGWDHEKNYRKVIKDTMRWCSSEDVVQMDAFEVEPQEINSMNERKRWWWRSDAFELCQFLVEGDIFKYKDYIEQFSEHKPKSSEKVWFRNFLIKNKLHAYRVDLTNTICKEVGVCVARVIIPELLPIYFSERNLPKNCSRLFTFQKSMGYTDHDINFEDVNNLPHPFL